MSDDNSSLWHTLDVQEVLSRLSADSEHGLDKEEATRRLQQHGPNAFEFVGRVPCIESSCGNLPTL